MVVREFWFKCRILFKIKNEYLRLLSVAVSNVSLLYVFICLLQTVSVSSRHEEFKVIVVMLKHVQRNMGNMGIKYCEELNSARHGG